LSNRADDSLEPELEPNRGEADAGPEASSAAPHSPSSEELLTVSEVAERAGVHENTVRKYLKANELPFFLRDMTTGAIVSGDAPHDQWPARYQYLLSAEVVAHLASQSNDVVVPSAAKEAVEPSPISPSEAVARETSHLRTELSKAERELSTAQQQLQELRSERDWLRSHLQDITAFLPTAKEDADNVRSELDKLQEQAQRVEGDREQVLRVMRLERQARRLAAMRFRTLPWWRRLSTDFEALVQHELTKLTKEDS